MDLFQPISLLTICYYSIIDTKIKVKYIIPKHLNTLIIKGKKCNYSNNTSHLTNILNLLINKTLLTPKIYIKLCNKYNIQSLDINTFSSKSMNKLYIKYLELYDVDWYIISKHINTNLIPRFADKLDFRIISRNKRLPMNILLNYRDRLYWNVISKNLNSYLKFNKISLINFLFEFNHELDWYNVFKYNKIPLDQICIDIQSNINLNIICKYQVLSEDFIQKYENLLNWNLISKHQVLSEDFIQRNENLLNWDLISEHQVLSEDFIQRNENLINWDLISKFQVLSDEFIWDNIYKVSWSNIFQFQKLNIYSIEKLKELPIKLFKTHKIPEYLIKKYIINSHYTETIIRFQKLSNDLILDQIKINPWKIIIFQIIPENIMELIFIELKQMYTYDLLLNLVVVYQSLSIYLIKKYCIDIVEATDLLIFQKLNKELFLILLPSKVDELLTLFIRTKYNKELINEYLIEIGILTVGSKVNNTRVYNKIEEINSYSIKMLDEYIIPSNKYDLYIILHSQQVPEYILRKHFNKFPTKYVYLTQKLSPQFIIDYSNNTPWNFINQKLSESFLSKNQNKLFWNKVWVHQKVSEEFIIKFEEKVNWKYISIHQKLSETFISKYKERVNWTKISIHQRLSKLFIFKYLDRLNLYYIFKLNKMNINKYINL